MNYLICSSNSCDNKVFVLLHTTKCFECITKKSVPNKTQLNLAYIYNLSCVNMSLSANLDPCSLCKRHNMICPNPTYKRKYPNTDKNYLIQKYGDNLCFDCIVKIAEQEQFFND